MLPAKFIILILTLRGKLWHSSVKSCILYSLIDPWLSPTATRPWILLTATARVAWWLLRLVIELIITLFVSSIRVWSSLFPMSHKHIAPSCEWVKIEFADVLATDTIGPECASILLINSRLERSLISQQSILWFQYIIAITCSLTKCNDNTSGRTLFLFYQH